MTPEQTRQVTRALSRPETALAAMEALNGVHSKAAIEGLVELLAAPPSARAAVAAIDALAGCREPIVHDALGNALNSPHASVRLVAIQTLQARQARDLALPLLRLLQRDEAWLVRRAALRALADCPDPERWQVLEAITDPHWRVRHALIQVLLHWSETAAERSLVDEHLVQRGPDARVQGVRAYLHYRWTGRPPDLVAESADQDPLQGCPFWDWDAAVLTRNLERLGRTGRRQAVDQMPFLLGHSDSRVRDLAADTLRRAGQARHFVEVLRLLDEPRSGVGSTVLRLLQQLDLDQTEEVARFVLHLSGPSPAQFAWALDQVGEALPPEEEQPLLTRLLRAATALPAPARAALARLAGRWPGPDADACLRSLLTDADPDVCLEAVRACNREARSLLDEGLVEGLLRAAQPELRAEAVHVAARLGWDSHRLASLANDPDPRVRASLAEALVQRSSPESEALLTRLQADPHPHVRASALTPPHAELLVREPARETSWHVLAKAARLMRVPVWKLEPGPAWQPPERTTVPPALLTLSSPAPVPRRRLGTAALEVAPVGVSGHYGLPVEGFVRAVEAGVNLFFWEPNYQTLTEFAVRLSRHDRNALHFIAGTFEADGDRVRRDAERALRVLGVERLAVFLLFWVQTWARVTPDVRQALERLQAEGKVAGFGLSTHARTLAVDALEAGWNPVMIRHSAAHRGAEAQVLPAAVARGTSIISFNNTCYGRLLQAQGDSPPPSAADCYRYTLAQPGVTVCLTAPATLEQLEENLAALRDPSLPEERRQRLQQHGDLVYQEDVVFRKLVRSR